MKKILVVEDDLGTLNNLEITLSSEGFDVITATDGLKALAAIEKYSPDLVLSDVSLPYLNGIELYQKFNNDVGKKKIPFIFLSSLSDTFSNQNGSSFGSDDYISKPFELDDVVNAVKTKLEKKEPDFNQAASIIRSIINYIPHELRNPLFPILGLSEIISTEVDSLDRDALKSMANDINYSAKKLFTRLEKFIKVYEIANLEKKDLRGFPALKTTISEQIPESIIANHYLLNSASERFKIKMEPCRINIKSYYLQTILKELMENAFLYSQERSNIIITGEASAAKYIINIRNKTGSIMPGSVSKLENIENFSPAILSHVDGGIGLPLSRKILSLFSGKIETNLTDGNFINIKIILTK